MRFEVRDNTGRVVMWTDDVCCIYPAAMLAEMRAAGYKTYLDGKLIRKGGVENGNRQ